MSLALLDTETLTVLRDLDGSEGAGSFLDEVITTFMSDTPTLFASLKQAVNAKNISSVIQYSHQLKGLCGNIGLNRLSALCAVIEDDGEFITDESSIRLNTVLDHTSKE